MIAPSEEQIARAIKCASGYRKLGYQPLPSRTDIKGPALPSFADFWDRTLPDEVYSPENWRTSNIQLMTGKHWKLMVVDLDGPEAIDVFDRMCQHFGGIPRTWHSRTGGGGIHHYFAIPEWLDECPSRRLWGVWDTYAGTVDGRPGSMPKGDWQKHKEIRILGDQALVIAPPSIHVETGRPYKFTVGPKEIERPADVPDWILKLPTIERPECTERYAQPRFAASGPVGPPTTFYRREEVLAAIPSPVGVARRWGLRTSSNEPNPKGWWSCWAIDREESRPSSQFHDQGGVYWCGREKRAMSLFDLGVISPHGGYATWQECRDALGEEFIGKRQAERVRPPSR